MLATATKRIAPMLNGYPTAARASASARPLGERHRQLALDFLSVRPIHNVIVAGWIRDHGVESPRHRGTFYGYWNNYGILEGVALIGQICMFETRSDAALLAFAEQARRESSVRLLFAENLLLEKFWRSYKRPNQQPRVRCRELLFEKVADPVSTKDLGGELRKATPQELRQVAAAHAQMMVEETGENPLDKDSDGFHKRCATRILEEKVWVMIKEGELLFKADVVAETAEVVYVEGFWVNPPYRRRGYGEHCWKALTRGLLIDKLSMCGFVNDENLAAKALYDKVGCGVKAIFDKILL